jgi:hypothetical protein
MGKKKKRSYKNYLDFLKTRLDSENFKNRVSAEEYEKTKEMYKREKFKRKVLDK